MVPRQERTDKRETCRPVPPLIASRLCLIYFGAWAMTMLGLSVSITGGDVPREVARPAGRRLTMPDRVARVIYAGSVLLASLLRVRCAIGSRLSLAPAP